MLDYIIALRWQYQDALKRFQYNVQQLRRERSRFAKACGQRRALQSVPSQLR